MRLSQMARKLGLTQNSIIEFLKDKGHDVPEGGNAKLTEEQVTALYKEHNITVFTDPEEIKDLEAEEVTEVQAEEVPIETPTAVETTDDIIETKAEEDTEKAEPAKEEADVEVIRVKKVKLEGIKVLGKIDLPEPKPKVTKEGEDAPENEKKPRRKHQKNQPRRTGRKRELTFEQKREREERQRIKEKETREQKLKEKKKKYFEENIKPMQEQAAEVVKRKKKKKKSSSEQSRVKKKAAPKTKNPLKRFWNWLNDPYA